MAWKTASISSFSLQHSSQNPSGNFLGCPNVGRISQESHRLWHYIIVKAQPSKAASRKKTSKSASLPQPLLDGSMIYDIEWFLETPGPCLNQALQLKFLARLGLGNSFGTSAGLGDYVRKHTTNPWKSNHKIIRLLRIQDSRIEKCMPAAPPAHRISSLPAFSAHFPGFENQCCPSRSRTITAWRHIYYYIIGLRALRQMHDDRNRKIKIYVIVAQHLRQAALQRYELQLCHSQHPAIVLAWFPWTT